MLKVSTTALDIPGTWISDGNAASRGKTNFYPPTEAGFAQLDAESIYKQSWNDADVEIKREAGRRRCAEVLVPHIVPRDYIEAIYCSCFPTMEKLTWKEYGINVTTLEHMFFR